MKTLKEMSDKERLEIVQALIDGRLEGEFRTGVLLSALLVTDMRFSVAKTKPSINWDHVTFDWITTDKDGRSFGYTSKPRKGEIDWSNDESCTYLAHISSFKNGTCNWKDSLVKRPVK